MVAHIHNAPSLYSLKAFIHMFLYLWHCKIINVAFNIRDPAQNCNSGSLMCLMFKVPKPKKKKFFFLIIRFEDVGADFWPQLNYNRQPLDDSNNLRRQFLHKLRPIFFPHFWTRKEEKFGTMTARWTHTCWNSMELGHCLRQNEGKEGLTFACCLRRQRCKVRRKPITPSIALTYYLSIEWWQLITKNLYNSPPTHTHTPAGGSKAQ